MRGQIWSGRTAGCYLVSGKYWIRRNGRNYKAGDRLEIAKESMTNNMTSRHFRRRETLAILGGAAGALVLPPIALAQSAFDCVLAPEQTEGPYWVDERLNRSDIRVDPTNGSVKPGTLLTLTMTIHSVNGTACALLPGAQVDIWHCDAAGTYSDVAMNNTVGQKFLRGYQVTDDAGTVSFTTIFPGWYRGRTVHIHFRVRTFSGTTMQDQFTAQLYFDDTITDQVFTQAPYNTRGSRDTRNANDMVLSGSGSRGNLLLLSLSQTADGYAASISVGVDITAPAPATPSISSGGVVNAAGYQTGMAPGAWTTIFGQNLASASRALSESDIVDERLPTTLGGVSVAIGGQPAFLHYVSPTQINVQTPASSETGTVPVTVTNGAGTSQAVNGNRQAALPGLFTSGNYVSMSNASGAITSAKSGDVISLYGTGFGATTPAVEPGVVFEGSAPHTSAVTVTIGGANASVSYAGLTGAGLTQINVTVPALGDGDHAVVAQVDGLSTQSGALLKVQN